jgi:acyl carrier protein
VVALSYEDELLTFIATELLRGRPGADLQPEDDILGSGIVDSLGVMRIVAFIEERFGITVPPEDVRIEHFLTVRQIAAYLTAHRDGHAG